MHDIITIGSATRDVFLMSKAMHPRRTRDAITHIEACFPFGAKINVDEIYFDTGGGATNNAATFARLGKFKVAAITRIGDDGSGREILSILETDRVETSFVQKAPHEHTAYSTILSPGGEVGERTILVYRGASRIIDSKKIPWLRLQASWYHASSLGGDFALLKKIISHAHSQNGHVAFNPGGQELADPKRLKPLLKNIDLFFVNREETSKLTGIHFEKTNDLLRALSKLCPFAIMTDGPKGAYVVKYQASSIKRQAYYIPSVGHKPKNITGAGDAFGAGFVTGWIKSKGNIEEALRVASCNADNVVQFVGAKNGILEKYPSRNTQTKLKIKEIRL
ncbi:MAG: carbohydrate kinase family protein [bacterium]|nr:carbohydrate kinase family protein [bacterium]